MEPRCGASGQGRPPIHTPLGSVLQVDPSQIPGGVQEKRPTWSTSLVSGHQLPGLTGPITLACWVSRVGLGGGIGEYLPRGGHKHFPPELEEETEQPTLDYNDQIEREDYEDCE